MVPRASPPEVLAPGERACRGEDADEPNVVILVAERDGDVLAYSYAGVEGRDYMSLRGPAGVLYDIVVDPARRRQGVGRMLRRVVVIRLGSACLVSVPTEPPEVGEWDVVRVLDDRFRVPASLAW